MDRFEDDLRREFLEDSIKKDLGPVVAIFRIDTVPEGAAPLTVREAWRGLALPVREVPFRRIISGESSQPMNVVTGQPVEVKEPVPVFGYDAIKTLKEADREKAAGYWERMEKALTTLVFQGNEGQLVMMETESIDNGTD